MILTMIFLKYTWKYMIPVYDVGVIIYFILFDMLSDASGQT